MKIGPVPDLQEIPVYTGPSSALCRAHKLQPLGICFSLHYLLSCSDHLVNCLYYAYRLGKSSNTGNCKCSPPTLRDPRVFFFLFLFFCGLKAPRGRGIVQSGGASRGRVCHQRGYPVKFLLNPHGG